MLLELIQCVYYAIIFWGFRIYYWIRRPKRSFLPRLKKGEDEILRCSALEIADRIRKQEVSCEAVVRTFIKRTRAADGVVNGLAEERFADALQDAAEVDIMLKNGITPTAEKAPFFGVPVSVKECIWVKGMLNTAGLTARRGLRATEDAAVVARLKQAGAIVLYSTNTSEMTAWWECYNNIYGKSCNPYDTRRTPGGSSGGEGAMIASLASPLGIGSDAGGSIRMPAYFCGIFGHKPSQGTVPSKEHCLEMVGPQEALNTFGPMCHKVEDLRPALRVLMDPGTARKKLYSKGNLRNIKFYYMETIKSRKIAPVNWEVKKAMREVIAYVENKYDVSCIRIDLPLMKEAFWIWINDIGVEGAPTAMQFFSDHKGTFNPLTEIVRWIFGKSEHTPPALIFCLFDRVLAVLTRLKLVTDERRALVRRHRDILTKQLSQLLSGNAVMLMPTHPTTAPFHNQPLFTPFNHSYTTVFNSAGLPVTQCPIGLDTHGLPLGIQIVAGMENDYLSISVAEEIANAFWHHHGPPMK